MTLGSRVVVMRDGVVQQIGEPMEVYRNPVNMFVAGFLGSPPMNFLSVTADVANPTEWTIGGVPISVPRRIADGLPATPGSPLVIGIRPEDLRVRPFEAEDEIRLPVVVDTVEPVGAEMLVHASLGQTALIARLDPEALLSVGESVALYFSADRVRMFDPSTELRLI